LTEELLNAHFQIINKNQFHIREFYDLDAEINGVALLNAKGKTNIYNMKNSA